MTDEDSAPGEEPRDGEESVGGDNRVPDSLVEAYLEKIKGWEALGYDVSGLEDLLFEDFDRFREIEEKILTGEYTPGEIESEEDDLVLLGEPTGRVEVVTEPRAKKKEARIEDVVLVERDKEGERKEGVIVVKGDKKKKPVKKVKKAAKPRSSSATRKKKVDRSAKKPVKRKSSPDRKIDPRNILYALVMIALVVSAAYLVSPDTFSGLNPLGEKLKASIYVVSEAIAGDNILFDGSNSTGDIEEYIWDFGDGTTGTGERTYHVYTAPGNYLVRLRVRSPEGASDTATDALSVSPLKVTVPEKMTGDFGKYNINGYFNVSNPSGLATVDSGSGKVTVSSIRVSYTDREGKPARYTISGTAAAVDGFDQEHSTLSSTLEQYIDLSISMQTSMGVISTTGTVDSVENSYTDLTTRDTIYTYTTTKVNINNIFGGGSMFSMDSTTNSYPLLNRDSTEVSLERIRPNRTFQQGEVAVGGSDIGLPYGLKVGNAENINGYPCLRVEVIFDDNIVYSMGLDYLTVYLWVSSMSSLPVKTLVRGEGTYNGNTTEFEYVQEMFFFRRGTTQIDWGSCLASGDNGHYMATMPGSEIRPWSSLWRGPAVGTSDGGLNYTLEMAYYEAIADSGLSDYLEANSNAYLVAANVTQKGQSYVWSLVWSSRGSASGYNVVVNSTGGIEKSGFIEIDPPTYAYADFNSSVTYGSAVDIFSDITQLAPAFASGSFDYSSGGISIEADSNGQVAGTLGSAVPSSTLDLLSSLSSPRYSYNLLYVEDRTYTAALDAETGQVVSVAVYTIEGQSPF